ncbi:sulfite exporter TauE/SafE family protein [Castellaniella sp. GW247-6E4]|uniref:sulfite exporter TauE/SafE family protein n=1 Tax=Castellaniella sp. GW247-6E4 TaxID=3140380 RepID=UPI00331601DF
MGDPIDLAILIVAAFGGGLLNAAAGGGTFLTLPALMAVGVPPVIANATGTVALLPGYIASTLGFREDLQRRRDISLRTIVVASLAGGVCGAILLQITPNAAFRQIVPWFMLVATLWFALWPLVQARGTRKSNAGTTATFLGVFAVAVYGGYFNGGLGIILLALFGALGFSDLNFMNGLKNAASAILTTIATVVYAWGGLVYWGHAGLMMVAAIIGGYVGARWARRIPSRWLRAGVVSIGTLMTIIFFIW